MTKFERWLNEYYVPVYYSSVWKSKANTAEYSDVELKQIYDSIITFKKR